MSDFLFTLFQWQLADTLQGKLLTLELPHEENGVHVLKYHKFVFWIFLICFIFFSIISVLSFQQNVLEAKILCVGFSVVSILCFIATYSTKIEFNDNKITYHQFFKAKNISWSQVEKVSFSPSLKETVLIGKNEDKEVKISVSMLLVGFLDFMDLLKKYLPALKINAEIEKVHKISSRYGIE